MQIVHSKDLSIWEHITYNIFDAPDLQRPFEERVSYLQTNLKQDFPELVPLLLVTPYNLN
jgi:hypothetical protein